MYNYDKDIFLYKSKQIYNQVCNFRNYKYNNACVTLLLRKSINNNNKI